MTTVCYRCQSRLGHYWAAIDAWICAPCQWRDTSDDGQRRLRTSEIQQSLRVSINWLVTRMPLCEN